MNIYVGNLDRQASEVELKDLFNKFGQVKSVKIIKDHGTGEAKGFAFVEMTDESSAVQAIRELNAAEFGTRRLKVNEAKPKSASQGYNSFSSYYGFKDSRK